MLLEGEEISSVLRGFYRIFLGTEITLFTLVSYCCPLSAQLPSTQYRRRYHTYLRRAVPTSNGACAEEMASPAHESDSSSGTTAKIAATAAAAEVVAGIAAAVVGTPLLLSFSAIYSEAEKSELSIILGQEIIDTLELSCCWRGQKSTHF